MADLIIKDFLEINDDFRHGTSTSREVASEVFKLKHILEDRGIDVGFFDNQEYVN
jgi:hypothetical protein